MKFYFDSFPNISIFVNQQKIRFWNINELRHLIHYAY